MTKKGNDFANGEEWENIKTYNHATDTEKVKNMAKSKGGQWNENWTKVKTERWCEKSGKNGSHQWNEKWYKKVFVLSKKKDEAGLELDEDESDGSAIEECNCEKWGRNEE